MNIKHLLGAVTVLGFSATAANAATVSIAGPSDLTQGDQLIVTIEGDFEGSVLGGGFDLTYDDGLLSFVSAEINAPGTDPGFSCNADPSCGGSAGGGSITNIAYGNFNGIAAGQYTVATLIFDTIGVGVASIGIGPNGTPAGPVLDLTTFAPVDIDYSGLDVTINAIPLPAAAWLMLGGLGMLLGFRRNA